MSARVDYYDRQGNPLTLERWADLRMGGEDAIRVALTELEVDGNPVSVSTVWLGLNHNWGGGPPLIFETAPATRWTCTPRRRRRWPAMRPWSPGSN